MFAAVRVAGGGPAPHFHLNFIVLMVEPDVAGSSSHASRPEPTRSALASRRDDRRRHGETIAGAIACSTLSGESSGPSMDRRGAAHSPVDAESVKVTSTG